MTKSELDRFRAILTAKVAELERFTRHREGITIERSADQLEEIQAASERALAVCYLDREFNQLRNARAALRRIQDGNFGTCQQCDEEIHPKRLAAVPWATLCMRCQEAVDNNLDLEEVQAPNRYLLSRAA
jgi:DnaK suppressor protein